jgi:hypothetical protein
MAHQERLVSRLLIKHMLYAAGTPMDYGNGCTNTEDFLAMQGEISVPMHRSWLPSSENIPVVMPLMSTADPGDNIEVTA